MYGQSSPMGHALKERRGKSLREKESDLAPERNSGAGADSMHDQATPGDVPHTGDHPEMHKATHKEAYSKEDVNLDSDMDKHSEMLKSGHPDAREGMHTPEYLLQKAPMPPKGNGHMLKSEVQEEGEEDSNMNQGGQEEMDEYAMSKMSDHEQSHLMSKKPGSLSEYARKAALMRAKVGKK